MNGGLSTRSSTSAWARCRGVPRGREGMPPDGGLRGLVERLCSHRRAAVRIQARLGQKDMSDPLPHSPTVAHLEHGRESRGESLRLCAVGNIRCQSCRLSASIDGVGVWPPVSSRQDMGRTIKGGPAHKIEACTVRLQVVLDIVIVPNRILYL